MISRYILILMTLVMVSCTSMEAPQTPATTIEQLLGTWHNASNTASLHFYQDESVKLLFPKRQPPIKMISNYQMIKDQDIGIALGGFWTGPMVVNISHVQRGTINISFPDEDVVTFYRAK
ncbi:MAG: hypothetical protein Q9M10_02375 [Mariprofundaceae bacterium]|nr:hypothetical protein [Mariprofundaceae bacterium]